MEEGEIEIELVFAQHDHVEANEAQRSVSMVVTETRP